jgi:hypothetical protein
MDCISLPFTRQVNQSFGSEPSQVPFYAFFAFFAVDRKRRSYVQRLPFASHKKKTGPKPGQ